MIDSWLSLQEPPWLFKIEIHDSTMTLATVSNAKTLTCVSSGHEFIFFWDNIHDTLNFFKSIDHYPLGITHKAMVKQNRIIKPLRNIYDFLSPTKTRWLG